MSRARYSIIRTQHDRLVIQDEGPWDLHKTVTNDAERVVAELHQSGQLEDRRLFYRDSLGAFDEITHEAGVFTGFAPG